MKTGAEIETERLIVRHWTLVESDRKAFHRLNSDKDVIKYFPSANSPDESNQHLEELLHWNIVNGYGWAAVCLKSSMEPIGFAGIGPVDYFEAAFLPADEIGWRLLPEHWHKGYATEAASALLQHGFDSLKLDRVVSFAVAANTASINVMKRIGMTPEPQFDFDHPGVPDTHPHLKRHVFYAASRP